MKLIGASVLGLKNWHPEGNDWAAAAAANWPLIQVRSHLGLFANTAVIFIFHSEQRTHVFVENKKRNYI